MTFQFGHRARYLGDLQVARRRTIAHRHGITFQRQKRIDGWHYWFEATVRGYEADVALTRAVAAEIDEGGS